MSNEIVTCRKAWVTEPRLKVGAKYDLLDSYFQNGEGWYQVRNIEGEVFSAPDVFFN